jgi:hypothetical protein
LEISKDEAGQTVVKVLGHSCQQLVEDEAMLVAACEL